MLFLNHGMVAFQIQTRGDPFPWLNPFFVSFESDPTQSFPWSIPLFPFKESELNDSFPGSMPPLAKQRQAFAFFESKARCGGIQGVTQPSHSLGQFLFSHSKKVS